MTIGAVLSGAPNDEAVLQSVVMMAARERREVKVTLAAAFPKSGFLRMLDAALGRVALAGLPAPNVIVDRRRDDSPAESQPA